MRKLVPIRVVAVVALAGSAAGGAVLATSGAASASKSPVAATCTSTTGSTTVAAATGGQPSFSLLNGCTGGKTTAQGVSVSLLNGSQSGGTATITWLNKKTTTYSYTVTGGSTAGCPTFLDQAASLGETITLSNVAGTAKINANGSFNVCVYLGSGDGTVYEINNGPITI